MISHFIVNNFCTTDTTENLKTSSDSPSNSAPAETPHDADNDAVLTPLPV